MIGAYKNWNIITFFQKSSSIDYVEKIHQVFLYGISDNMSALVKTGKYGTINTTDATTHATTEGCYNIDMLQQRDYM